MTAQFVASIVLVVSPHISTLAKKENIVGSIEKTVTIGINDIDCQRFQVVGRCDTIVITQHITASAVDTYIANGDTLQRRYFGDPNTVNAGTLNFQLPPFAGGKD